MASQKLRKLLSSTFLVLFFTSSLLITGIESVSTETENMARVNNLFMESNLSGEDNMQEGDPNKAPKKEMDPETKRRLQKQARDQRKRDMMK